MKLTAIDTEISRFDVSHWVLKSTPGTLIPPRAWLSRSADGPVFLELDMQISAQIGEPIFYLPGRFGPNVPYFPPGYAADTGQIYRRNDYLMAGATFSDVWVRRMWSWFLPRSIRMTSSDLMISPPPRFLARFSRRLRAGWGGRSETHTDHTQRHRLARTSALGHRWKCHLRNHPPRDGDRWWYGRRYLDSQNPGESNTCNLGSFSNVQRGDNRSSIGLLPEVFPVPHRHIQGVVRDGVCEHRRRESVYQLDYRRPYSIEVLCDIRNHADVGRFRYIPHDVPRPAGVTVGGVL